MVTPREPSLGELAEDLHIIQVDLRALVDRLDATYVRRDVYELAHRHLEERTALVEERIKWAIRAAITGLLLPILVTVVVTLIVANGGAR